MSRIRKSLGDFFLAPASPRPIGALRIAIAACLLLQASLIWGDLFNMYGQSGILQGTLNEWMRGSFLPGVNDLGKSLVRFGIPESQTILGLALTYLVSVTLLLLGYHTRAAAIVAFLTHTLFLTAQTTSYGVDSFAHVFLFYLAVMPSGNALSLDCLAGRASSEPTPEARVSLRVLQIQLCIVYFFSGVEKMAGEQWWNGEAIFRSLMLPLYSQRDFSWLANFPLLAKVLCWGTLFVETGYPLGIWSRKTRPVWIAMTVGLHVGIIVFLGLGLFGLVMTLLTLTIFGVSAAVAKRDVFSRVPVPAGAGNAWHIPCTGN